MIFELPVVLKGDRFSLKEEIIINLTNVKIHKEDFEVKERFLKRSDYKTQYILDNCNERCNVVIQLTNEINKFDRIFKFYILNFKDYFKIKVLKTTC